MNGYEAAPEDTAATFKQTLELATQLYAEFEPTIRANLQKEMDGVREFADYPNLIRLRSPNHRLWR